MGIRTGNPNRSPIEAVYVFPFPENSAVDDMRMTVGDRVIRAEIRERNEARRVYERAKRRGNTAALLEQERPNVFTQSVANIAPGETIEVTVRYVQTLTYDAGEYEFVFPMVVGPRFIPGRPVGRKGTGWSYDTDQVPDASRITPPILGRGARSGHDISLEVSIDAGLPVADLEVPTHDVHMSEGDDVMLVTLQDHDTLPNRDFVMRYKTAGDQPRVAMLSHREDGDGYFTLVVQPPQLDIEKVVGRREFIFVVDVSGSMSGIPLGVSKAAMRDALQRMRPVDTFNVITFAGRTGQLFSSPRPANETNIQAGEKFISGQRAGGGTMMAGAVQAALSPPVEHGRNRYVFFLTDGYIGNERAIFDGAEQLVHTLASRGQRARVFGLGVGSSVNRHLIDGIAKAGDGVAVYASHRDAPARAVDRFFRATDHPVLTNVHIDWGGLQVEESTPLRLPDLFATRPLLLHGRYSTASSRVSPASSRSTPAGSWGTATQTRSSSRSRPRRRSM